VNNKTVGFVGVAVLLAALATTGYWYREYESLGATRAHFALGELQPIATLLKDNQTLIAELQSVTFAEKDSGILESYLAKTRRDGVPKHADMKQRLDQLAENNTAIVTLIKAYAPNARTAAFSTESDKFRNYASAWRDRWNSVMELFMAGGNYAAAEFPFPNGFPGAVQAEIAASR
jgi:hypothetical protein